LVLLKIFFKEIQKLIPFMHTQYLIPMNVRRKLLKMKMTVILIVKVKQLKSMVKLVITRRLLKQYFEEKFYFVSFFIIITI